MDAAPPFLQLAGHPLRCRLLSQLSLSDRTVHELTGLVRARIHLIVDDIAAEVARLKGEGASFRNDILSGPGGQQILLQDPAGNVIELFQPARR